VRQSARRKRVRCDACAATRRVRLTPRRAHSNPRGADADCERDGVKGSEITQGATDRISYERAHLREADATAARVRGGKRWGGVGEG
jgi:hypothetical protein